MTDQRLEDVADHIVTDGARQLEFRGVCLGSSSSHQPGKTNWAEIFIFRTEAGKYIVAGIGRTKVEGQHDKCWAQVCEEPACVIERLHLHDDVRGRYLPYVQREAIEMARLADPAFTDAYMVEHVD